MRVPHATCVIVKLHAYALCCVCGLQRDQLASLLRNNGHHGDSGMKLRDLTMHAMKTLLDVSDEFVKSFTQAAYLSGVCVRALRCWIRCTSRQRH